MIFDRIYFLNVNQSGFRPGDSGIDQLIAISRNIFTAFDANPSLEVCSIFLHFCKAFDRVWNKCLLRKFKNNGIDGSLLSLIESFLHSRYRRVVLNSQSSNVNAGVLQGSVLRSLFPLFILIIFHKVHVLISNCFLIYVAVFSNI